MQKTEMVCRITGSPCRHAVVNLEIERKIMETGGKQRLFKAEDETMIPIPPELEMTGRYREYCNLLRMYTFQVSDCQEKRANKPRKGQTTIFTW